MKAIGIKVIEMPIYQCGLSHRRVSMLIWVTIPERCGYMVLPIDDKRILLMIVRTPAGTDYLQVAGFYDGKEKFVGEKLDKLAVLVQPIPAESRLALERKISEALPGDLKGLRLTFMRNLE